MVGEAITGNGSTVTRVCSTTKALRCSIMIQSHQHYWALSCEAPKLAYRSQGLPAVRQGLLGSKEVEVIYCTCFFSKCCSSTSMRASSHSHKEEELAEHTSFR